VKRGRREDFYMCTWVFLFLGRQDGRLVFLSHFSGGVYCGFVGKKGI
jgi:hypothetical protein